jgi:hypothetical protein
MAISNLTTLFFSLFLARILSSWLMILAANLLLSQDAREIRIALSIIETLFLDRRHATSAYRIFEPGMASVWLASLMLLVLVHDE